MKFIRINEKLLIMDGRNPLQYVDLATNKLYKYPAHIDESSEWPVYKWWRNPIKWRQWRKMLKIVDNNAKFVLQTTMPQPNPFWKKSEKE